MSDDATNTAAANDNDASTPLEELIALYALDALDENDRAMVERRLTTDGRARALLDEYYETAGQLHTSVAEVQPSARVKQRLMARVDADLYSRGIVQREESVWHRILRALRAISPALAVLALVVAFGLGAWAISLQQKAIATQQQLSTAQQQLGDSQQQLSTAQEQLQEAQQQAITAQEQLTAAQQELALLQQPGLRTASIPRADNAPATAQATLILAPDSRSALLSVSGLPKLDPSQTYEFWLIRDGKPVPAGIFNVDAQGNGRLLVQSDEPIGRFQQAGITVERAGGTDTPTLSALVSIGSIQ